MGDLFGLRLRGVMIFLSEEENLLVEEGVLSSQLMDLQIQLLDHPLGF